MGYLIPWSSRRSRGRTGSLDRLAVRGTKNLLFGFQRLVWRTMKGGDTINCSATKGGYTMFWEDVRVVSSLTRDKGGNNELLEDTSVAGIMSLLRA